MIGETIYICVKTNIADIFSTVHVNSVNLVEASKP